MPPVNYAQSDEKFKRVSKSDPCPLCQKTDWCSVSGDGKAVLCPRTDSAPSGWKEIKKSTDGHPIYVLDNGQQKQQKDWSARPRKIHRSKKVAPAPIPEGKLTLAKLPAPATDSPKPKPKRDYKEHRDVTSIEYWYSDNQWVERQEWENPDKPKGREKTFRQHYYFTDPDGVKWDKPGKGDQPWTAYRIDEALVLINQVTGVAVLLLVEGEKCVEALREIGLAAITFQGSSWGKDAEAVIQQLAKFPNLVLGILPDYDKAGEQKAAKISEQCDRLGLARIILNPFSIYPELEDKQDCVEMIEAMGADLFIESLEDQIHQAVAQKSNEEENCQDDDDQPPTIDDSKLSPTQKAWIRLQEIYGDRIRWNEMTLRCEIDGKPAKEIESIYLDLELDYGISISKEKTYDLVLRLAKLRKYHPVKEYLNRVASKVEPINIDNLATRFLKTTLPIYDAMLKAHLIGSVKRIFQPGCKKDEALILQGKQGIGKSTFFSKLYGREFFSDSLKGTDRDNLLILHQYWCLEMAEIESITGKKQVGELKSFITSQEDTFRSPYGKSSEPHERQSVLVGTVNPQTFLQDETGNRRFWVIPVKSRIDSREVESLRDAIWASAVLAYRNNELSILTHEQEAQVNELNLNYVHHDSWADVIDDYLLGRSQVTCREILEKALFFEIDRIDKKAEMRVGNVLRQMGWERTTGYYLGKTMKYWQPSSLTTLPPVTTSSKEVVTLTHQDLQPPLPPILQTFQNGQTEEVKPDSHAPSESESVENANQNNQEEKFDEKGGKGGKTFTEQALPPHQEELGGGKGGKGGNAENVVDAIADTAPKRLNVGDTVVLVSGKHICPEYTGDLIVYKIDGFFGDKIACQNAKGEITTWLNIEDLRLKNKK
ncbi:MAG: VapE domain-containing protein [Crinalium sp.]